MIREKLVYFIGVMAVINLFLFYVVLGPKVESLRERIEGREAVETAALEEASFYPLYHDYYYDYLLVESRQEGEWQVDCYKEVKTIVDENGQKIAQVDTGRMEYVRYWVGN